jgi:hypothetical protein
MNTAVRALVSAFTTVTLIMALASAECVACDAQARVSAPPCCNPNGDCRAAGNSRPCLKIHTQTPAVVEQTIRLVRATGHVNFEAFQQVVFQCQLEEWPPSAQYSPPYLYLLHSSFLI